MTLLTEFFELIITMGYWLEGCIQRAPHVRKPINSALTLELGYEPQVVELMQKLPYLVDRTDYNETCVVSQSRFIDYRRDASLRKRRWPLVPHGDDSVGHPPLDAWILLLVDPKWYGYVIYLDTRLGAIRSFKPYDRLDQHTVEWRRHPPFPDKDRQKWTHEYRRALLVSVDERCGAVIEAYRSLKRLPYVVAEDGDLGLSICPGQDPLPDWAEHVSLRNPKRVGIGSAVGHPVFMPVMHALDLCPSSSATRTAKLTARRGNREGRKRRRHTGASAGQTTGNATNFWRI